MDDYVHLLMAYITHVPNVSLYSPFFHLAFSRTLAALTCPAPETILICLDTLSLVSQRFATEEYRPLLQPVFAQYGKAVLMLVLGGVVQGYPEEGVDQVHEIVAATVFAVPAHEAGEWVAGAIGALPGNVVPPADKQAFLAEVHE
jgi:transportin-3